ncbi:leucine-rich PPR motif-containing protein, mitochondrial-like [Andrena cerasifolii]|uniref:leucine-rich PPR motif-containing protein, mitochondrial-like n=1 Tax=Andrena cerasifolii TaxID=2819439 RepID=UPI004037E7CD
MILLRGSNKLFTSIRCVSAYSKISSLSSHNQFVGKYIVALRGCAAEISPYKCCAMRKRYFSNDSDRDDDQSFEYKIMMLRQSINNQNVNLDELEQIIQRLESNDCNLPASLGVMLLKCCGNLLYDTPLKTRQELTSRTWNLLKISNCKLSIDHYHALLHTYIDNACTVDPYEFLNSMTVKPEYETYCLLLKVLSNVGDFKSAEAVLSEMGKEGLPLGEQEYNALVHAYSVNGNTAKAKEVISSMAEANIQPSPTTNVQLLFASAKNKCNFGDLMEVMRTTVIPTSDILKLVKLLSLSDNGMYIPNVLRFMQPIDKAELDVLSVIAQLVHEQHSLDAYAVINHVPINTGVRQVRRTLAFCLVKEMIKMNVDPKLVLKIVADFAIEHNITEIWEKAVQFALYKNNQTLVFALFEEMKAKNVIVRSEYYWSLLSIACENGEDSDIFSIIKHMIALKNKIDSRSLTHYVFPHINTSDPALTVKKMFNHGIAPIYVIQPLMMYLLNEKRVEESLQLCKTYKKKIDCQSMLNPLISNYKTSKNIDHCIELLFKLSRNGQGFAGSFLRKLVDQPELELRDFTKFLNAMRDHKAFMSAKDIMYMENKVLCMNLEEQVKQNILQLLVALTADENEHNYNSGEFVHPEYMNENQLQSHLQDLKNTGKNARGVLRKLLIIACKKNDAKQVDEILEELKSKGMKSSPGMRIALFDFYTKNKMIKEASIELQEIQSLFSYFRIDNFKILQFVLLLLQENMVEDAFNIIKECKEINQKPDVISLCSKVLSQLACSDYFNHTETMVHLLVEKGYCTYNSSILRWLVVGPLLKGDIESAVKVFRRCVSEYNKTPGKQELLTELIKQVSKSSPEHNQFLQDVYGLIDRVHGHNVTIANLAIALALCNKINELRNLVEKENISGDRLLSQIQFLKEDDIIKAALTMLEVGGEIFQGDFEPICYLILTIYNERGDFKSAEELEEKMRKCGVTPGEDFQIVFNTLRSHKFPVSNLNTVFDNTIINKYEKEEKHNVIQ